VPASLIVTSIGYSTPPMDGVAYDERGGKFLNDGGLIADRLYAVGWARRGPTGTIGTNRPDGFEVAEAIDAAFPANAAPTGRAGAAGLDRLLQSRGCDPILFADWQKIEAAEVAAARLGFAREKLVRVPDLLKATGR